MNVFYFRSLCKKIWTQREAGSPGRWELQPGGCGAESGAARRVQGKKEPTHPHRVQPGAAAGPGAQLPPVPLPVGAGATHHRLGPPPLRDPGEDLVSEQTHQVEEGARAGQRAGGGARLLGVLPPPPCPVLLSPLQAAALPPPAAPCPAAAAAAPPPLLHVDLHWGTELHTKGHWELTAHRTEINVNTYKCLIFSNVIIL